jgi:predicted transcriptional regulator
VAARKRTIEVDAGTASSLEARAAEAGVSVSELVARLVANDSAPAGDSELAELDRQWAAIEAGEPTVAHDEVVRWLETWGTADFRPWSA